VIRCGVFRGWPVLSSHFSPGLAPQVRQRICSRVLVRIATFCPPQSDRRGATGRQGL
jgi:hypothetical protein